MYSTVLLDLDGTVADSARGVINSVIYSLEKCGVTPPERESLYRFIGPPLHDSFADMFGFSPSECDRAVEYYREYYRDRGIYEVSVYEGIVELIESLREKGKLIMLATSKPEPFAERILAHVGIDKLFDVIAGATFDGTRSVKEDVLRYALERGGVFPSRECVLIGDTKYDIIGARAVGIDSIGVLHGYGSREEMEAAGATYIVDTARDVMALFEREE